jgi:hypothetical protein
MCRMMAGENNARRDANQLRANALSLLDKGSGSIAVEPDPFPYLHRSICIDGVALRAVNDLRQDKSHSIFLDPGRDRHHVRLLTVTARP